MTTRILNSQAAAWSSYIDTHHDLLPAVKDCDAVVRNAYKIGQYAFIGLIAGSHVIANASERMSTAFSSLETAYLPVLSIAGWLVIKAIAHLHMALREAKWGFSASSLQKIYKAQPGSYDTEGWLRCINCGHKVHDTNSSTKPRYTKVKPLGSTCQCCGFNLWPGCNKVSALIQNHNGSL